MKFKLIKSSDNWYEKRWDIARRDIAKEVAKNYSKITGIDINTLFYKDDDYMNDKFLGTFVSSVNTELFDQQLPKIIDWVVKKYQVEKSTVEYDTDFVDLVLEKLENLVDIDKVPYEQ